MTNYLQELDHAVIGALRSMARQGRSPSELLREARRRLGDQTHIVTLLSLFREAFHLTLAEAKPIAALSRNEERVVEDESLLDQLLSSAIASHRSDWECDKKKETA